ncbi:MAG: site-specific integrase [Chitinophagaceae bacterium]|nr:site-specific integrase [Chitinophagaceae bacterium]
MLEQSFGLLFFLKTPRNNGKSRLVYLRVTIDGIQKEKSTKRKWDIDRWDQRTGKAIGNKEDAKILNHFLDSLVAKIYQYRTELLNQNITITSQLIADYVAGKTISKAKVLEEFQTHNDELAALVKKGQYAEGTHERYVTARSHVKDFIRFKYGKDDLEFRELNYEFVQSYDIYLRTVRDCANNTALKYVSNFKKIVLRAVKNEIIPQDPFKLFSGKKTKIKKKPLTTAELHSLETKVLPNERLSIVRDVSVFQAYTGLAYCDVYKLVPEDIGLGEDGKYWIFISRKKTDAACDIPLLPKAMAILEKYKNHPTCIQRGSVLPVRSNQKMNAYLKEIQALCNINLKYKLDTHRLRRTFASTVALKNGVPIHIVKELLGHASVQQTEDYAITEQETVSKEMLALSEKISPKAGIEDKEDAMSFLLRLEKELNTIKDKQDPAKVTNLTEKLAEIERNLKDLRLIIG